jgi:hypothetical protein
MSDEFDEFQVYLSNLKETVNNIVNEQLEAKARSSIDVVARAALRELLVDIGMAAFYSIPEYADNEMFAELFKKVLQKPQHVSIKDGEVITAFDESAAGDAVDLFNVPEQHTLTNTAPAIWKYGIYGPAHGGPQFPSKVMARLEGKIPDFDTVISERVSFWGNIAPFWILIDKGTNAFGDDARAYPNFAGTNFVDQFRLAAPRVTQQTRQVYLVNLASSLGAEVEILLKEPRKGATITIARIPVSEGTLAVQLSSAGNVFYRIGRSGISFEQAKAIVKRAYK